MGKSFWVLVAIVFIATGCGGGAEKKLTNDEIMKYGPVLFTKYTCVTCHSINGAEVYGPSLNNFYMKETRVVRGGEEMTIVADRNYLKKAIEKPSFEKVAAYRSKAMPETHIPKKDIEILTDYIIAVNQANQAASVSN
jgi:mono/diheme cytochrome c family protein